ncbi:MAG: xanthine dehydrogenase family protein molybdopterin-binding subunit [Bryobacteraceae bacterium]
MNPLKTAGHPTQRIDALKRVTGTAKYTSDKHFPGMLYARVLRSPHPHARVKSVDVSKAQALPGVKAIITRDNCDVVWSSGDTRNKRYLFNNPVRYAGDAVACVAAVDRHTAEEATRLIAVEYETLPFVLDAEEALKPEAPEIQPGGNLSPDDKGKREAEVYRRGNLDRGFAAADIVLEDRFQSAHHNNAQLEPRVSIAFWEGEKLTVHAATQGIANCRTDIARDLKLPVENVRVICDYMGGGFGNKNQCQDSDLMAAVLSKKTGVPVKVEFSRKEDFISVHGRWPVTQYYKVGAKKDGTLTALQVRGYSGMGPYRKGRGDQGGPEVYQCANVEQSVTTVYTNMAVSANYRAPAYPHSVFGLESVMDDIATRLKMDPLEFRLKNMTRKYRDSIDYSSIGLEQCLREGAEKFEWKKRWHEPGLDTGNLRRGVGMAMGGFGSSVGKSEAILKVGAKGQYYLYVGVTDVGTAAKTTMGLIAAEELAVPLESVTVHWGDTADCPYSVGESGGRTTSFTGVSVVEAAKQLKKQIAEKGMPKGSDMLTASVVTEPDTKGLARYSFLADFCELEVDMTTGHIKILKFLAVHDSGRVINPLTSQSQVQGGVIQGLSMALHEELLYDKRRGIPINAGYYGARIMTHLDVPLVETMFIETDDPFGPFGAKTLGEPPIVGVVAAVANAFFNATGRRVKSLPFSRDKVLDALGKKEVLA